MQKGDNPRLRVRHDEVAKAREGVGPCRARADNRGDARQNARHIRRVAGEPVEGRIHVTVQVDEAVTPFPLASIVRLAPFAPKLRPTAPITPQAMATSATPSLRWPGSMTRPPLISSS